MNKRSLGIVAVVIIVLMVIVAFSGLDGLPRSLAAAADAASTRVASDRAQFNDARAAVERDLNSDPELFRTQAAVWRAALADADTRLKEMEAEAKRLAELRKADKKSDTELVKQELQKIDTLRGVPQGQGCAGPCPAAPLREARNLRDEADRWIGYKQNLPAQLSEMKSRYEALHAFDIRTNALPAQKAAVDWPAKKDDIEKRIQTLEGLKKQGEEGWAATAESRAKAEAKDYKAVDYATLFSAGDAINKDLREIQRGVREVNRLTEQLYRGRDKVLLELDDDHGTRQKVKVVETRYASAALSGAETSSHEDWEEVDKGRFDQLKKSLGMVVERKPAGKYDSETEKVIQPPAYAYIAPPGQANQYGSWNNGVWTWLPQYLILSQMLRHSSQPTISTYDWQDYQRARSRGDVWYGRNGEYGSTWSRGSGTAGSGRTWGSGTSSQGGGTISSDSTRRKDTWNTGGSTYGGSKYESKGGFGGSKYQSRPSGGGGFGSRGYGRSPSFSRGYGRGGRR